MKKKQKNIDSKFINLTKKNDLVKGKLISFFNSKFGLCIHIVNSSNEYYINIEKNKNLFDIFNSNKDLFNSNNLGKNIEIKLKDLIIIKGRKNPMKIYEVKYGGKILNSKKEFVPKGIEEFLK